MIFTKRSDYGLRAAMELAAAYGGGPLSAHQIARRGNLPEPFVRKLMQELAQAGLAASRRGRNGGYVLARSPERVTVRETLEAFETLAPVPCLALRPARTAVAGEDEDGCTLDILEITCPTRAAWHLVDERVRRTLDELTLDDLLREVHRHGLADEMAHVR